MRRHVKKCWGEEILKVAGEAKYVEEAWNTIVKGFLRNGKITTYFEQKDGKHNITYSTTQLSRNSHLDSYYMDMTNISK